MALSIEIINGHPVVVDSEAPGVPYQSPDNLVFTNAATLALLNVSNVDQTGEPDANDDGFSVGAIWRDTNTDNLYFCVDNTPSNAVWEKLNAPINAGSGLTGDGDTTPLTIALSPNAGNSLSLLANGLYGTPGSDEASNLEYKYNVLDYAANSAEAAAYRDGSGDASIIINAAITAAYNSFSDIGYLQAGSLGASINRRVAPTVYLPYGIYNIENPILATGQGLCISIVGGTAVLKQGSSFPAYRSLMEIGGDDQYQSGPMNIKLEDLIFTNFNQGLRLGVAPTNINLGRIVVNRCDFLGKKDFRGIGCKIFNRSANIVFRDCQFDSLNVNLEVESADIVILDNCRSQIKGYRPASERSQLHGWFIVRKGHLIVNDCTLNPPTSMTISNTGSPISTGIGFFSPNILKKQMIDDTSGLGNRWYVAKTSHIYSTAVTGNATNDRVTFVSGFPYITESGAVKFNTIVGGAGLSTSTIYYARNITGNSIDLYNSPGGSKVNFTTNITAGSYLDYNNTQYFNSGWHLVESPTYPMGWFKIEDFEPWISGKDYYRGDLVDWTGAPFSGLYVAITGHTSGPVFISGNWTPYFTYAGSKIRIDVKEGPLSVWSQATITKTLLGGEGGGIFPVIWNSQPDSISTGPVQYQKSIVVEDCIIGNDLSGYTIEGPASVLLMAKRPNFIKIKNNKYGYTRLIAADYWSKGNISGDYSVNANTLYVPFDAQVEGNYGTPFAVITSLSNVDWTYSANWIPDDLALPKLYPNLAGGACLIPSVGENFRLMNNGVQITRFTNVTPGRKFTLIVNDTSSIADGNYIRGAGALASGVGGGSISYVCGLHPDNSGTYKTIAYEVARSDHQ